MGTAIAFFIALLVGFFLGLLFAPSISAEVLHLKIWFGEGFQAIHKKLDEILAAVKK